MMAVAGATAIVGVAAAHQGATGVVETRMDAMKEMADRMKMIGGMIQGKSNLDVEAASNAAGTIAEHAASIPELFPEGSATGPSEARPRIWREWEMFSVLARKLEKRADSLQQSATSASAPADLAEDFRAIGSACKSCHEDFRQSD